MVLPRSSSSLPSFSETMDRLQRSAETHRLRQQSNLVRLAAFVAEGDQAVSVPSRAPTPSMLRSPERAPETKEKRDDPPWVRRSKSDRRW